MWERIELKQNAKAALSRYYWMGVLVSLVYSMLAGVMTGGLNVVTTLADPNFMDGEFLELIPRAMQDLLVGITLVLTVVALLLAAFAGNPLLVGLRRYFQESREFRSDFSTVFWGFTGGRYWNCVKVMFFTDLRIFLWSLPMLASFLLIFAGPVGIVLMLPAMLVLMIPMIIKSLQYTMVQFLLAENTKLPTARYFELTTQMTAGEKGKIFVLGLSFIGWNLLALLTCGIGMVFLSPYIYATYAELAALLRAKALTMGFASPEELHGFTPQNSL